MHELAVTQSILEIALRHAEEAGASKITDLYLVIGRLSSIVDDSVQFYWEMIAEGTPAAGSQLHFKRLSLEIACLDCQNRYSPDDEDLACPKCGSTNVSVVSGEEFYLEAIDVESD